MPSKNKNRRTSQRKGKKQNYLRSLASSLHAGVPADRITNNADFNSRPKSWVLTQTPPKSLRNLIYWFQKTVTFVNGQSISTSVPGEYNYAFTIATVTPEYTYLLNVFDQYAIHSVIIHLVITNQASSTGIMGRVTTALDYDNVANLGSESSVQEYSTAQTVEVRSGLNIERALMPCVDPQVYQVSGTGYGAARMWLDSASTNIPHYGYRSYWSNNLDTNLSFDLIVTSIIGFRNSI